MVYDVFISYSQPDKSAAEIVCELLERNGIQCWIAPRNIPAGVTWANSIVRAIEDSRAMALICSSHANESRHMARELELADARRLPIVPIRMDKSELSGDLQYFLHNTQWFDAFPGEISNHGERMVATFRQLIDMPARMEVSTPGAQRERLQNAGYVERDYRSAPDLDSTTKPKRPTVGFIAGATAIVLGIAGAGYWGIKPTGVDGTVPNGAPSKTVTQPTPAIEANTPPVAAPNDPSQRVETKNTSATKDAATPAVTETTASVVKESVIPAVAAKAKEANEVPSFAGTWLNLDRVGKGGVHKFEIQQNRRKLQIHGYGACRPVECDWSIQEATVEDGLATVIFPTNAGTRAFKLSLDSSGALQVETHWLDGKNADKAAKHTFAKVR